MYGVECPYCGDILDPGERCECRIKQNSRKSEDKFTKAAVKTGKTKAKFYNK